MSLTRKVNSLLAAFDLQLVNRSVLYDWQKGEKPRSPEPTLPDGAASYLVPDNQRLQELRQRYDRFQTAVSIPIVWTDDYVQSYGLQYFRGDNCYVWQTQDPNCDEINYCLTTYYVKAIDRLGFLGQNSEDGLFGAHAWTIDSRTISRDLLDSMIELCFLEEHLGLSAVSGLTVLDIGAGYGRLAHRAACSLPGLAKYLCTDAVPESTFLSEYYTRFRGLGERVAVVPLDEITDRMAEQKIDLAVNIHSFSECSLEAIEWWLKLLAANRVKHLFIAPNASDHGGTRLALNSGEDFSFLVEKYGYRLMVRSPKYGDPLVQKYGVSPTYYYLYQLAE